MSQSPAALPPRADIEQLRRLAKELLRRARDGDAAALASFSARTVPVTLAGAQLCVARDHGFASWSALRLEVARRRVLDLRDADALAEFVAEHPEAATDEMQAWIDHPLGASPLGYLAMARFDTVTGRWRDVEGTGAAAHVLIAAGAPVDGHPGDSETPLITAASYGDADVAAVLIAAGADVDAVATPDAGGVPGGSALLHAAVFGMTEVLDLLVAAGARVRSIEEAAAAGDVTGWLDDSTSEQERVRSVVMAADHERVEVLRQLAAIGTPIDVADEVFGRHPLRLAAADGRTASVEVLLALGADPRATDDAGRTPLDHCRMGREHGPVRAGHDATEALLVAATSAG